MSDGGYIRRSQQSYNEIVCSCQCKQRLGFKLRTEGGSKQQKTLTLLINHASNEKDF